MHFVECFFENDKDIAVPQINEGVSYSVPPAPISPMAVPHSAVAQSPVLSHHSMPDRISPIPVNPLPAYLNDDLTDDDKEDKPDNTNDNVHDENKNEQDDADYNELQQINCNNEGEERKNDNIHEENEDKQDCNNENQADEKIDLGSVSYNVAGSEIEADTSKPPLSTMFTRILPIKEDADGCQIVFFNSTQPFKLLDVGLNQSNMMPTIYATISFGCDEMEKMKEIMHLKDDDLKVSKFDVYFDLNKEFNSNLMDVKTDNDADTYVNSHNIYMASKRILPKIKTAVMFVLVRI